MAALVELQKRVTKLESLHFGPKSTEKGKDVSPAEVDDSMRRARFAVESAGLYSACWKWVPESYYTWGLEERRKCLNAASTRSLCKSLLLENKKCSSSSGSPDHTNPPFVLVVVQYAAALDTKKLATAIRSLRSEPKQRLTDSDFDFRVASSEDNDRITGYAHNSVTPFGLLSKEVPIVLAGAIADERFFWMGGGHIHLKLGMSVTDFCDGLKPLVADISQPRADHEMDEGPDA